MPDKHGKAPDSSPLMSSRRFLARGGTVRAACWNAGFQIVPVNTDQEFHLDKRHGVSDALERLWNRMPGRLGSDCATDSPWVSR